MKRLLLCLILCTVNAYATMPVIDYTEVVKTTEVIAKMNDQYTQMKAQYETLKDQYNKTSQQYDAMTGNYGWGMFKNGIEDLKQSREWAPGNWQDALKGMSGGNPARYQELVDQYKQANKQSTISSEDFRKGSDAALTESFENQSETNVASSTQASYVFENINKHLEDLHELGEQIEKSGDMKSALDLNSRIQIEIAYIQTEELRMMALLNQQEAQFQRSQLSYRSQLAKFNAVE